MGKMGPTRHVRLATLAVVAAAGLTLAGCNTPGGGDESAGGATTTGQNTTDSETAEPTEDPNEQAVEQAGLLASQYDYNAALNKLKDIDTQEATSLKKKITGKKSEAVNWKDNSQISHLFYHSLIVDPQRAFSPGPSKQGYADYMVTLKEFKAMLSSIYDKGYVLVNPHDIARRNAKGQMEYRTIKLPKGKKPLVLSEDDVSYYEYMKGDGFATNLALDKDGNVTNTYTDASGKTKHGAYDLPTVVNDFVEKHPDFSYRGSKGILALTGYNGVLGYRTSDIEYGDDPKINQKKEQAKEVADALKEDGWVFASHSWGHVNMTTSPLARIKRDTRKWDKEVRPILGGTDLLIFPFGADLAGVEDYSSTKYQLLKKDGFDFYFGIDTTKPAWMQLTDDYVRQARINVDGLSMKEDLDGKRDILDNFFDTKKVIDHARPGKQ